MIPRPSIQTNTVFLPQNLQKFKVAVHPSRRPTQNSLGLGKNSFSHVWDEKRVFFLCFESA